VREEWRLNGLDEEDGFKRVDRAQLNEIIKKMVSGLVDRSGKVLGGVFAGCEFES
jgi:hypothetical protein